MFVVVGGTGLLLMAAAAVTRLPSRGAVVAAFLAGFGFAGAALFPAARVSTTMAVASGLAAGVTAATIAFVLGRALPVSVPRHRDGRPRVGCLGTVVTCIPADGAGEVTLIDGESRLTVAARADSAIATGATIVVIDVPSEATVRVAQSHF